jgi:fructose-bisphosphate aldolase, class I
MSSKLEDSLAELAHALTADGKGILAADETIPTVTARLARHGVDSTFFTRRDYRELFFSTSGIGAFIGGVILQDETIRQPSGAGQSLVEVLTQRGVVPGIKVDDGAHPLAGAPDELITEGLDGLRPRLEEYRHLGARFAKWRAVLTIAEDRPSVRCVVANAHALARYAALCQEQGLVPIVEPEVLIDGAHSIERCEAVTSFVLRTVFDALDDQGVVLEGLLLKPSMVIAGAAAKRQAPVDEVAAATVRTLARHVPPAVPGIVFLSGGQSPALATQHLNAINRQLPAAPWKLSFSFGRALQDEALAAWKGRPENVEAAQHAFVHRARCCSAAARGEYEEASEALTGDTQPPA